MSNSRLQTATFHSDRFCFGMNFFNVLLYRLIAVTEATEEHITVSN